MLDAGHLGGLGGGPLGGGPLGGGPLGGGLGGPLGGFGGPGGGGFGGISDGLQAPADRPKSAQYRPPRFFSVGGGPGGDADARSDSATSKEKGAASPKRRVTPPGTARNRKSDGAAGGGHAAATAAAVAAVGAASRRRPISAATPRTGRPAGAGAAAAASLCRPLLGRSSISERANARAGEVAEMAAVGTTEERALARSSQGGRKLPGQLLALAEEQHEAHFEEMLRAVEHAMAAGHAEALVHHSRTLRAGEAIGFHLMTQEQRFFLIPLPKRSAELAISVVRVGGGAGPAMYASSAPDVQLTKQEFEMEAEMGEITYHHEVGSERNSLHLLIVGIEEPCNVRLRCAVRRSDEDAPPSGYSAQRRVAERLERMRQDPVQLKARIHMAKEHERNRCRRLFEKKDFIKAHVADIELSRPSRMEERLNSASQRRRERHEHAAERRESAEREQEARARWWANKEEAWANERLEMARLEEDVLDRPQRWLDKLAAAVFASNLFNKFVSRKTELEELRRKVRASKTIQEYVMKRMSGRRRGFMMKNALMFKMGLVAYCRHGRLGVASASQSRVRWFLENHKTDKTDISIGNSIHSFLLKVRLVQRTIRKSLRIVKARLEACAWHFTAENAAKAFQAKEIAKALDDGNSLAVVTLSHSEDLANARRVQIKVNDTSGDQVVKASTAGSSRSSVLPKKSIKISGDAAAAALAVAASAGSSKAGLLPPPASSPRGSTKRVTTALPSPKGAKGPRQSFAPRKSRKPGAGFEGVDDGAGAPGMHFAGSQGRESLPRFLRDYTERLAQAALDDDDDISAVTSSKHEHDVEDEMMPRWLKRHVLRQHILEMRRTFPDRMKLFESGNRDAQLDADMRDMGWVGKTTSQKAKRPRIIELARLPKLYEETYDKFVAGKYRYLFHDRKRKMMKVWQLWRRVHRGVKVDANDAEFGVGDGSIFNLAKVAKHNGKVARSRTFVH